MRHKRVGKIHANEAGKDRRGKCWKKGKFYSVENHIP